MNIDIETIGGVCPMQIEGLIDDVEFYFRARGQAWALHVGGEEICLNPKWSYEEAYGATPYAAGYMTEGEAVEFLHEAAAMYVEWRDAQMPS